jgi:glycosyltransferase involved in cell wall biosynthesis
MHCYLFDFHKYLNPGWYFHLKGTSQLPYFLNHDLLSDADKSMIEFDASYPTRAGALRDAAYQAWQKGVMLRDPALALNFEAYPLTVKDNYQFIKRYFNPIWLPYILLLRLISFKNPINELGGFFRTFTIKRHNPYKKVSGVDGCKKHSLSTTFRNRFITIVIPTLNRYEYLKDVLADLEKQTYKHFEVIVVDQSEPINTSFYEGWNFNLQLVQQKEKQLWLARNVAVKQGKGDLFLLFDDDSRVDPDWIESHLKCLDYYNADLSSGISLSVVGARIPENYSYFRWSDQLDTGNVLVKKSVFEAIGLFDRQFEKMRMGDGEFGLRAYLNGFVNVSNPLAKRIHLKVSTGGLRQMGSWDAFRPKKMFAPRPIPSVNYLIRKYFGNKNAVIFNAQNLPTSYMPYRFKSNSKVLLLGAILFVLFLPILIIPAIKSWRISSRMLKEGERIDRLS